MVRSSLRRSTLLLSAIALLASLVATPASAAPPAGKGAPERHGGLLRGRWAAPGHRREVRLAGPPAHHGARSSRTARRPPDSGLLTQAPPNTGAGWYSLATGAWPGVTGSTNNTFHVNGQPFANRTAAFDANVLQAESIAQTAERGGLKVAQVEWAGGRSATINGPTIDYPSASSPAAASRPTTSRRRARRRGLHRQPSASSSTTRPASRARRPSRAPPRPTRPAGRTSRPPTARPRRCASASSTSASTSTASTPTSSTARTTARSTTTASCSRRPRTGRRRRHAGRGQVGRRQGQDHRRLARGQDRRHAASRWRR